MPVALTNIPRNVAAQPRMPKRRRSGPAGAEPRRPHYNKYEYPEYSLKGRRRQGHENLGARECPDAGSYCEGQDQCLFYIAPHHEHPAGTGAQLDQRVHGDKHGQRKEERHKREQHQAAGGAGHRANKCGDNRGDNQSEGNPQTGTWNAEKILHQI